MYVLVTSFSPLEAFFYKDGFARFATVPYSCRTEELKNRFIHLTNSSVNRLNKEVDVTDAQILGGTKINFAALRKKLRNSPDPLLVSRLILGSKLFWVAFLLSSYNNFVGSFYGCRGRHKPSGAFLKKLVKIDVSWPLIWQKMLDVVLKSLVMAGDHIPHQVNSFEIFGYDIIFDDKLTAWLIEVQFITIAQPGTPSG